MQHAPHVNTTRSLFTDRAGSVFIKTINTHYAKNCLGLNDGGGSHNPTCGQQCGGASPSGAKGRLPMWLGQ